MRREIEKSEGGVSSRQHLQQILQGSHADVGQFRPLEDAGAVHVNGGGPRVSPGLKVEEVVAHHDQFDRRRVPLRRKTKESFGIGFRRRIVPAEDAFLLEVVTDPETVDGLQRNFLCISCQYADSRTPPVQGFDERNQPRCRLDPFQKSGLDVVQFVLERLSLRIAEGGQVAEDVGPFRNAEGVADSGEIMDGQCECPIEIEYPVFSG
jgi:hypothetical protein